MSNTQNELEEEFARFRALIRHLRETDGHFLRLSNEYGEVSDHIQVAEAATEPVGDLRLTEMRKERLRLKDEIYGMLVRAEPLPEPIGEG